MSERFGGWQEVALRALAGAYDAQKAAFGPEANNAVQEAIKAAAANNVDPALAVSGGGLWLRIGCWSPAGPAHEQLAAQMLLPWPT